MEYSEPILVAAEEPDQPSANGRRAEEAAPEMVPPHSRTGPLLSIMALGTALIGQWQLARTPFGAAPQHHEFNPSLLPSLPWFVVSFLCFGALLLRRERPALWRRVAGVGQRMPWVFGGARPYVLASLLFGAMAILRIIAHERAEEQFYWDAVFLWIASMASYLLAFRWPGLSWWRERWQAHRREILAVLGLTLVAGFLRFVKLGTWPDIMNGDEGLHSLDARRVAEGTYGHPFATFWGSGTFYLFFVAFWERLLDYSVLATRIMPAIGGTLGVPATYLFARRLFDSRVAFVAAGLVAFLHAHVHFSRVLGVGYINVTLFASLGVYLLYSAMETGSLRRAALGGVILGSWVYVYIDSRFVPPVLIVWLVAMLVLPRHRAFVLRNWRVLAVFIVGYALAAAPMILWGLRHPTEFNQRFQENGVLAKEYYEGRGDLLTFIINQWVHSFLSITYHSMDFFYSATVPILDLLSAAVFWIGLVYAALRTFDRRFLLLNIWFWAGVTTVGLFTLPRSSDGYRLLTAFIPLVIMSGVVVTDLATGLSHSLRAGPKVVWGAIGTFLLAVCLINANIYFGEFQRSCRYGDARAGGVSRVAFHLGTILHEMRPGDRAVFVGSDAFFYPTHASMEYMNRGAAVENWQGPISSGQLMGPAPDAFILHSSRYADLAAIQAAYPGGKLVEMLDCGVPTLYNYSFTLPPQQSASAPPRVDPTSLSIQTSTLDMGVAGDLFDGNADTLVRGATDVNPLEIDIGFPAARKLEQVDVTVATMDFQLDVEITRPDGTTQQFTQQFAGLGNDPTGSLPLVGGPYEATRLKVSISQLNPPPGLNIHVRELAFK